MAQDCRQIIFEAITEKQGDTVRGYALSHLLRHLLAIARARVPGV